MSDGNVGLNWVEKPESWCLHQRRKPNTFIIVSVTLLDQFNERSTDMFRVIQMIKGSSLSLTLQHYIYIFMLLPEQVLNLTLRSGMEKFQYEATWVLVMVCLSFSTLADVVLSKGTEINQRSVMTSGTSQRHFQSKVPSIKTDIGTVKIRKHICKLFKLF